MDIINGSKTVQSDAPSDSFEAKFGKTITFRQLYDLFKRHKQYVFNRKIPQCSCLCEICGNVIFLTNGINKKLFPECHLPETIHELVAKFSCSDTEDCTTGKCEVCSSTKLTCDNFNTSSDSDSTSDDSSGTNEESHSDGDSICYYKWARCDDNQLQKVFFKTSIDESIQLLNSPVKTLNTIYTLNVCNSSTTTMPRPTLQKMRYFSTLIIAKVIKISNNEKYKVHILGMLHLVFSPLVVTFAMSRTK